MVEYDTSPKLIAVTVTPVCDTSAYASGDLIFDATAIAAAVRTPGGCTTLKTLTILDKADQGVAFTLVFANAATDFGTLNDAPNPDDTEAGTVLGHVAVATADYVDLGASKFATVKNINCDMKAAATSTSLWVACINSTGTPTYGASDLVLTLYFERA